MVNGAEYSPRYAGVVEVNFGKSGRTSSEEMIVGDNDNDCGRETARIASVYTCG